MKTAYKDIIILSGLFLVCVVLSFIFIPGDSIDIQLHDSYYVVSHAGFVMTLMGIPASLVFFPLALKRRFDYLSTNICLLIALCLVARLFFLFGILISHDRFFWWKFPDSTVIILVVTIIILIVKSIKVYQSQKEK